MVISDLNHLEVIANDAEIIGGWRRRPPTAEASAAAIANAIGYNSFSETATRADSVAGYFSTSVSVSYAVSKGYSK